MPRKISYRVRNWKNYNRSLINRGNITLWFDESTQAKWHEEANVKRKRGRQKTYSDSAIESLLTFQKLFDFALRTTQGFAEGLFHLLEINLSVPDYSTLSRRAAKLQIDLGKIDWSKAVHVVIDATGLKVFGEGEWKCRIHGKSKRRTWRKLHLAIDRETGEIVNLKLTKSNVHDSIETKNLLEPLVKIATVTGDKGYDNKHAYDAIAAKKARAIIPPRSGAALKRKNISWGDVERNRLIRERHFIGKNAWKYGSGYTLRSLVETAIHRYKCINGDHLHLRKLENQKIEAQIGAKIVNRMTHLGMPDSYKV